jgi:hypothetical protein
MNNTRIVLRVSFVLAVGAGWYSVSSRSVETVTQSSTVPQTRIFAPDEIKQARESEMAKSSCTDGPRLDLLSESIWPEGNSDGLRSYSDAAIVVQAKGGPRAAKKSKPGDAQVEGEVDVQKIIWTRGRVEVPKSLTVKHLAFPNPAGGFYCRGALPVDAGRYLIFVAEVEGEWYSFSPNAGIYLIEGQTIISLNEQLISVLPSSSLIETKKFFDANPIAYDALVDYRTGRVAPTTTLARAAKLEQPSNEPTTSVG